MATSPAAFSCLLASVQQFREQSQSKAYSEDVALNPCLVRAGDPCQGCPRCVGGWGRTPAPGTAGHPGQAPCTRLGASSGLTP